MMQKTLKWARLAFAAVSLMAMTVLFVFPVEQVVKWLGWLPEVQIVPAVAAGAVVTLIALFVLTILFGRVYCSVVCPLGVAQDFFRSIVTLGFLHKRRSARHYGFSVRTLWIVRVVVLFSFVMLIFCGMMAYLEPYGIFARTIVLVREFVGSLLPKQGIISVIARHLNFREGMVLPVGVSVIIIFSACTILGATIFRARWWCNTVCPVGTVLGIVSRWSVFRVRIRAEKCVGCGLCAKACAAGAIVSDKVAKVDNSRCVACMNCADVCKKEALKWR